MSKPKLLMITKDNLTFQVFADQVQEYFGDYIEVMDINDASSSAKYSLALASSTNIVSGAIPLEKVVFAKRSIDITRLEQLIKIPDKSKVIVVNNLPDITLESIQQLKTLGFKFDMIPYYPGITSSASLMDIDTAINFVGEDIVPSHIQHVYNMGRRPLDISTIIEIAVRLDLHTEKANATAKYMYHIISLTKRLFDSVQKLDDLNQQLDGILNTVHDGIISTNPDREIIQINSSARRILNLSGDEKSFIGKPIDKLLPGLEKSLDDNQVLTVSGKHLVVNETHITSNNTEIAVTVFQDVTRIQQLEQSLRENIRDKGLSAHYTYKDVIGSSAAIKQTMEKLKKIASAEQTVIIFGESGTGKELFAHAIHNLSSRRDGPFLPVNFAGLPESLAESELFGYDEGSFTGAKRGGKRGLFELAHHGTIFLDEIGDAPQGLQALLLRVLQEKIVMRVGGHRMIPIDVRVIAATNKNLKALVQKGTFREDLYYRLFVLPLRIPPLRERKEDIILLFNHFLKSYTKGRILVDSSVSDSLLSYEWPGNVRELKSVVQYISSVMDNCHVTLNELPEQFTPAVSDTEAIAGLRQYGDLKGFYFILSVLSKGKICNRTVGRGKIVKFSKEMNYSLTDQQVRLRINQLRKMNFVDVGIKGEGSKITPEGERALSALRHLLKHETSLN